MKPQHRETDYRKSYFSKSKLLLAGTSQGGPQEEKRRPCQDSWRELKGNHSGGWDCVWAKINRRSKNIIWFKATLLLHTGCSVILARCRQCAYPSCTWFLYPSRTWFLWPRESAPQTASRSVKSFLQDLPVFPSDTQTAEHATSVAIRRVTWMRPWVDNLCTSRVNCNWCQLLVANASHTDGNCNLVTGWCDSGRGICCW